MVDKEEINNKTNEEYYPIVLSFDVGLIHLSYCLLKQKKYYNKTNNVSKLDWEILDWNNIDLSGRDNMKCIECGKKANMTNMTNNKINYYCKIHGKKVEINLEPYEEYFKESKNNTCCHILTNNNVCGKKSKVCKDDNNYCTTHAKQIYNKLFNNLKIKDFKMKSSKKLEFDDVKYNLMMVLENKPHLLKANYVVIENQPSFKNPRMKSIASTIYDYYLIRGIIDKERTKSNIFQVKFMSPSNKLKVATEGDTKLLVKVKADGDDTKKYKLTKALGIKYCLELITHLPIWTDHFKSFSKKDDLADSFLQGAYFYTHCIKGLVL